MKRKIYAFSIIGIFLVGILLANIFGVWYNGITNDEYKYHIENLNGPEYFHNRGQVPNYDENNWKDNIEKNRSEKNQKINE